MSASSGCVISQVVVGGFRKPADVVVACRPMGYKKTAPPGSGDNGQEIWQLTAGKLGWQNQYQTDPPYGYETNVNGCGFLQGCRTFFSGFVCSVSLKAMAGAPRYRIPCRLRRGTLLQKVYLRPPGAGFFCRDGRYRRIVRGTGIPPPSRAMASTAFQSMDPARPAAALSTTRRTSAMSGGRRLSSSSNTG